MAIEDRNLAKGTKLVARHKKTLYSAEVVETDEGVRYRIEDGREFKSPSAAAKAITGGAVNGWRFWSLAGEDGEPTDRRRAAPRKEKGEGKLVRQVRKLPNQRGVPEGQVRYYCAACQEGFLVDAGTEPDLCPEGHAREVEDELVPVG